MPFYYPGGRIAPSAPVSPKTMPATATGTTSARPPLPASTPATGSLFDSALAQYRSFPADVPPSTASSTMSSAAPPSLRSLASSASAAAAAALPPPLPPPPPPPLPFSHDDAERTRRAYAQLADGARAYREALGQLSAAASGFGAALETCARLKEARDQPYPPGPYGGGGGGSTSGASIRSGVSAAASASTSAHHEATCTADVLLAAAGFYFLQANQHGVLGETVYRSFELPVVHELDRFGADVEAEQAAFETGMRDASRAIRRLEKEGAALRKTRRRDLAAMRAHLVAMTAALDALTVRQAAHATALLDQSRGLSAAVGQAGRNLVRAELDILDSLARKGWPGGGLDVLLDGADDVFAREDDDEGDFHGTPLVAAAAAAAAATAATTSAATPPLGPKLLLLGQNGPAARRAGTTTGAAAGTAHDGPLDSYDLFLGGTDDDDDDGSDVSTIDGHEAAAPQTTAPQTAAPPTRPRRKRVDSLSVDPGAYDDDDDDDDDNPDDTDNGRAPRRRPLHNALRYQSLDSVAAAPAAETAAAAGPADARNNDNGGPSSSSAGAGDGDADRPDRAPPAGYDPGEDEGVHAWRA